MNNNNLKYYRGAIVEVMENCGTMSIIKIKGGAKLRVESTQLLDTDENKTRLPEWITVGACAYLDGDILTITRVGNTQYEATGIKYSTHKGAINYLLHHGRAVVECDTDREPIQRPADYDKLTNITVADLNIDTNNIFELMTTANEAGADNLAAYAHGLICSGDQPDTDTITDLIEGLLWTLQEDVEENEAEAEEVREKIEKTKTEGYEVYIDSCDDTNDPATIQNAKKLFNEDIADNLSYLDDLYNNYIYPALSRLRAFVAAFSTDGATTDDPAQYAMDFEAVTDATPAAELPTPPAVVYVSEPCPPTPTDTAATVTDADVLAQAARIKAIYDDLQAEADSQPAGMSCDDLPDTTPIYTAADVEKMIEEATADTYTAEEVAAMVAAAVDEERARHTRRRFAPRLRPVLRRLGRVAAVVLPLLIVALFMGASTDAAPAADAETVAQVIDLPAVTVTAEALDTFIEDEAPRLIEDKAPRLIEDKAPAPSPVKKLAAPSPVKNVADAAECSSQKTDTADTPAGEKTASPMAPAADAAGLTICEGTPWAYTMMNWA